MRELPFYPRPSTPAPLGQFAGCYPGELLYSVAARHHYLAVNYQTSQTRLDLFGSRAAHVISDFPCRLEYFSERTGIAVDILLHEHTILDYFRPFTDARRMARVEAMMRGSSSQTAMNTLGIQANQLHFPWLQHYCPRCAAEDVAEIGTRYLRVVHHLPGVYVCAHHRCVLLGYHRPRRTFVPETGGFPIAENAFMPPLLRIADWATGIWSAHSEFIEPAMRVTACRRALNSRHLITARGYIRIASLCAELKRHWQPLFDMVPFNHLVHLMDRNIFPRSPLYHLKQQFHPIKHIVLLDYLFGSWDQFREALQSQTETDVATAMARPSGSLSEPSAINVAQVLKDLADNGGSLRKTAAQHQRSVNFIKAIALRHGVQIQRRPQKISNQLARQIWRQLFVGTDTETIARQHALSVSSIEQLLTCDPLLVKQRQYLRRQRSLRQHRHAWQKNMGDHPNAGRLELRCSTPATYIWLYRHDREWLTAHLPTPRPAHRPRRTNTPFKSDRSFDG